jgi:hypothetical protein
MRYCPPYASARKTGRPKLDKRLKVHWKGRVRGREGMTTRGKWEERGGAQINEGLFW